MSETPDLIPDGRTTTIGEEPESELIQKVRLKLRACRPSRERLSALARRIDAAAYAPCKLGGLTYIYFIRCGAFVKVGYSDNPEARLSGLQYGTPYKLEMLKIIKGTRAGEQAILEVLSGYHHQYEWFHLLDDLRKAIGELRNVRASRIERDRTPDPLRAAVRLSNIEASETRRGTINEVEE